VQTIQTSIEVRSGIDPSLAFLMAVEVDVEVEVTRAIDKEYQVDHRWNNFLMGEGIECSDGSTSTN
jgi:hypothetical protein